MSVFQKLSLLFLALILVAVVALVAVVVFKPLTQTVITVSATPDVLSAGMTSTSNAEFIATIQPTLDAIATSAYACLSNAGCPTDTPPP